MSVKVVCDAKGCGKKPARPELVPFKPQFAEMPDIQNNSQAVGAFLLCADEVDALLRGSPRVPVVVPKPGEESEQV